MLDSKYILLIEDDAADQELVREMIGETTSGHRLHFASSLSEGIEWLSEWPVDVVLLDLGLPESYGLDTLKRFRKENTQVPVIVLTGLDDQDIARDGLQHGAQDYIAKTELDEKLLKHALRYAIDRKKIEAALEQSRLTLEQKVKERTAELATNNRQLVLEIEERKRTERQLIEHKKILSDLAENIPGAAYQRRIQADGTSRFTFISSKGEEIFGIPLDSVRKEADLKRWVHPEDRARYDKAEQECITQETGINFEGRLINAAGETKWFNIISAAQERNEELVFNGIILDIDKRKELERQLIHAQKMEAIGTLAGGIAHDFNNILSAILGYSQLCLDELPAESTLYDNLMEVVNGGKRASDLVRQILTFSRQSKQTEELLHLPQVIEEALTLLRASLPASIEIRREVDETIPPIMANGTQVHQVVMNLCTNAKQAMEEQGGTLSLNLAQVSFDRTAPPPLADLAFGRYAKLEIADTGHGIAKPVLKRIFDPYFTTKSKEEGTGLGLATVLGIVERHRGYVLCDSKLGEGTMFSVYLPLDREEKKEQTKAFANEAVYGSERLLVIDDEEPIARATCRLLESTGYHVTYHTCPVEALQTLRARPDDFDVVVSDMTMPKMTGEKLAVEIKKIKPEIPFILCTGYSESVSKRQAREEVIDALLMKPVDRTTLTRTIRQFMDEAGAPEQDGEFNYRW